MERSRAADGDRDDHLDGAAHDRALVRANLRLTVPERLAQLTRFTAFAGSARRARGAGSR